MERNFLKAVALSIFALVLLLCMVVYNVGNATGRASLEKRDYGRSLMPLIQSASRSLSRAALPVPPVEYGGYTPTIYAAPADVGSGNGSSEANAMDLATALSTVTAGGIVGLIPGDYTITPPAPSDYTPAFQPTNSGSSGNPIRIVAKYPAAANYGSTSLYSSLSHGRTAVPGNPTFGSRGKDFVEWIGVFVDEVASYSTDNGGIGGIAEAQGCAITHCVIRGDASLAGGSLHSAIRVNGTDDGVQTYVAYNKCYNVGNDISDANQSAILVLESRDVLVEHNECWDSSGGIFVKRNGAAPGNLIFRYNYIHDCNNCGIRIGTTNPNGSTAYTTHVHNNLCVNIDSAGFSVDISSSGTGDQANVIFQNNTAVNCYAGFFPPYIPTFGETSGGKFYNNIIASPTTSALRFDGSGAFTSITTATFDFQHNVYYSFPTFVTSDTISSQNFAYWTGTVGQDTVSPATITSDPLFINAGTGDYKLQAGSPARDLGVDILDLQGGGTSASIHAGCYVTGSEVIGTGY